MSLEVSKLVNIIEELASSVITVPNRFSIVDRSSLVGLSSIQVLPDNANRNFLFIQNSSKSKVWIEFSGPAQQGFPSMQLSAGQTLLMEANSILTNSVSVVAEVVDTPLVVKEG